MLLGYVCSVCGLGIGGKSKVVNNAVLDTQWPSFENRDNKEYLSPLHVCPVGELDEWRKQLGQPTKPPTLEKLKENGLQSSLFS